MRYMGGKFRQSKAIAEYIDGAISNETTYIEPFCGMCSVAKRVHNKFDNVILADSSPFVVRYLNHLLTNDFVPPQFDTVEELKKEYDKWKQKYLDGSTDPMLFFWGHGLSMMGDFFQFPFCTIIRNGRHESLYRLGTSINSAIKMQLFLRSVKKLKIIQSSYDKLDIPDNSFVYCDPPYSKTMRQETKSKAGDFDSIKYWDWVRNLSKQYQVICTEFTIPDDFDVVHEWGNTTAARPSKFAKKTAVNERLVKWSGNSSV